MTDEFQPQSDDQSDSNSSPSSLFLEMMRQAAIREDDSSDESVSPLAQTDIPEHSDDTRYELHPGAATSAGESAQSSQENTPPPPRIPIYTAPETSDSDEQSRLEEQRVRRLQRRQERRRRRRAGAIGGFIRTALLVIVAGALSSTIFTWFTEPEFLNPGVAIGLQVVMQPALRLPRHRLQRLWR